MKAKFLASVLAGAISTMFGPGPRPYRNEAPAHYRRGFHEIRFDPNVKGLRAFWVDERPGWGPRHICEMNARNGVGSSKIRKARAQ